MRFQTVILWDESGDEHLIAVRNFTSYEDAEAKAISYGRDRMFLNIEGAGEGEIVETITGGMTAIN